MTSPENPSPGTPEERATVSAMLDIFAANPGGPDIFGPGTNVEPPLEGLDTTTPPETTGQ